ncbi:MAG TPA: acyltransferase [Sphingomicrobium sp.]|nr:acyltransferase [Sphingomicrobium sp.]
MRPEFFRTAVPATREHGLDLVRAAAIASVMLYHAKTMGLMAADAPALISFGWMGVDLFFVLSGFLIAGQLLKPLASGAKPDYPRFFGRRALRTIPAFAAVLALYFAVPQLRETPAIQPFWQFATFTENLLFRPDGPRAFDQVWSLCVEEQFYLLFPLALSLLSIKPSTRKTAIVLLGLILAGIFLRGFLWLAFVAARPFDLNSGSSWQPYVGLIYYPTWSRLDGLLAGIALAVFKIFRPSHWKRFVAKPNLLFFAGLAGIGAAMMLFGGPVSPLWGAAIGFPLLSASVALIVAAASTGRGLVGKYRLPGGEALATGAYSLYLTHKMVYHAVQAWIAPPLGTTGYATFMLASAAALLAGALLYWMIERPFLILRDRWDKRRRTPARLDLLDSKACELERAIQVAAGSVGN